MVLSVSSWEWDRYGTIIWSQSAPSCLLTPDEKNKVFQRRYKAANSSWNHLSGLAGTFYRAMRFPITEFLWIVWFSTRQAHIFAILYGEGNIH